MANEIVVLEGDGADNFQVLFLYPIAVPATNNGTQVAPANSSFLQPSSALPLSALERLSAGEITAIDAGDGAFEIFAFTKQAGLTDPQQSAMLKELYNGSAEGPGKAARYATRYDEVYKHIGTRINP